MTALAYTKCAFCYQYRCTCDSEPLPDSPSPEEFHALRARGELARDTQTRLDYDTLLQEIGRLRCRLEDAQFAAQYPHDAQ